MVKSTSKKLNVLCPTCQKKQAWTTENPSRPFCNERCKLIDLGEWASESHSIAGNDLESDIFSENLF